jgi:hypothetical protein
MSRRSRSQCSPAGAVGSRGQGKRWRVHEQPEIVHHFADHPSQDGPHVKGMSGQRVCCAYVGATLNPPEGFPAPVAGDTSLQAGLTARHRSPPRRRERAPRRHAINLHAFGCTPYVKNSCNFANHGALRMQRPIRVDAGVVAWARPARRAGRLARCETTLVRNGCSDCDERRVAVQRPAALSKRRKRGTRSLSSRATGKRTSIP